MSVTILKDVEEAMNEHYNTLSDGRLELLNGEKLEKAVNGEGSLPKDPKALQQTKDIIGASFFETLYNDRFNSEAMRLNREAQTQAGRDLTDDELQLISADIEDEIRETLGMSNESL